MAGFQNTDTVGGRVAAARVAAGFKSGEELAKAIRATGYYITRQTINALESKPRYQPRAGTLEAIAAVVGMAEDDLRYGARDGESFHVTQLRTFEGDLEDYQWARLVWLAREMAEETRARRAEAAAATRTGDVAALAESVRAALLAKPGDPSAALAILEQAQRESTGQPPAEGTPQSEAPGRRRTQA